MANANEIVLKVENIVYGANGNGGASNAQGVPMQNGGMAVTPQASRQNGFAQGISAQMFVESATRIISATGNTELASGLSKAGSYGFLLARVVGSQGLDVAADVALITKATADVLKLINDDMALKRELAIAANEQDILRLRTGGFSINANTMISTDRFGRKSYTDRK